MNTILISWTGMGFMMMLHIETTSGYREIKAKSLFWGTLKSPGRFCREQHRTNRNVLRYETKRVYGIHIAERWECQASKTMEVIEWCLRTIFGHFVEIERERWEYQARKPITVLKISLWFELRDWVFYIHKPLRFLSCQAWISSPPSKICSTGLVNNYNLLVT